MKIILKSLVFSFIIIDALAFGTILSSELIDSLENKNDRILKDTKELFAISEKYIAIIFEGLGPDLADNKISIYLSKRSTDDQVSLVKGKCANCDQTMTTPIKKDDYLKTFKELVEEIEKTEILSINIDTIMCNIKEDTISKISESNSCFLGFTFKLNHIVGDGTQGIKNSLKIHAFDNIIVSSLSLEFSGTSNSLFDEFVKKRAYEFMNKHLQSKQVMGFYDQDIIDSLNYVFGNGSTDLKNVKYIEATNDLFLESIQFRVLKEDSSGNPTEIEAINHLIPELDEPEDGKGNVTRQSYLLIPFVSHMSPIVITVIFNYEEVKVIYSSSYFRTYSIFANATKPLLIKSIIQETKNLITDFLIPLTILENSNHNSRKEIVDPNAIITSVNARIKLYDGLLTKSFVGYINPLTAVIAEPVDNTLKFTGRFMDIPFYTKEYPLNSLFDMSVFINNYVRVLYKQITYIYPYIAPDINSDYYKYSAPMFAPFSKDKLDIKYFSENIFHVPFTANSENGQFCKLEKTNDEFEDIETNQKSKTVNYYCKFELKSVQLLLV